MTRKESETEVPVMSKVEVRMKRESFDRIIEQAMFLGQVQYMTMIEPARDRIKQGEARRYLKRRGLDPKVLDQWTDMRLVHRRKDGDSKNCAVYYSLREIQRQITVTEMARGNITEIF
jgi:hypothetical protein